MSILTTLENVFAAVVFAEKGDFETARYLASGKESREDRPRTQTRKRKDSRARLRA